VPIEDHAHAVVGQRRYAAEARLSPVRWSMRRTTPCSSCRIRRSRGRAISGGCCRACRAAGRCWVRTIGHSRPGMASASL